jgi:hypothetical protein
MEFASRLNARASPAGLDVTVASEFAPQFVPAMASSLVSWILAFVIPVLLEAIVNSNQQRKNCHAQKHAETEFATTTTSAFAKLDSAEKTAIQSRVWTSVARTAFVFQMASVAASMATQALTVVLTRRRMRAQKPAPATACLFRTSAFAMRALPGEFAKLSSSMKKSSTIATRNVKTKGDACSKTAIGNVNARLEQPESTAAPESSRIAMTDSTTTTTGSSTATTRIAAQARLALEILAAKLLH